MNVTAQQPAQMVLAGDNEALNLLIWHRMFNMCSKLVGHSLLYHTGRTKKYL